MPPTPSLRILSRMSGHPGRHAFTLIELLTVIAIIGILAAILIPTVGAVRESARTSLCMSRLRTLGQGFQLFASDNKDRIPYYYVFRDGEGFVAQQTWHAAIAPYVLRNLDNVFLVYDPGFDARNERFLCPSADESTDFSYAMNREAQPGFPWSDSSAGDARTIGGKRLGVFPAPGRLILLAEQGVPNGNEGSVGPNEARWAAGSTRHRGRANYLFLDGSVRLLAPAEVYAPSATPPINLWVSAGQ